MNKPSILIIDDDAISSETMAVVLEEGFAVSCAESGEAALASIAGAVPDLVLLDIEMEGMDGFEVCRRIRLDYEMPVIFVSAHDTLMERLRAFDCGGDDFVVKPCSPEVLLRKAGRMVEVYSERRQLATEKASLQEMAMDFLNDVGRTGLLLNFMRSSLNCTDIEELARRLLEAAASHGLTCHVQIRLDDGSCTLTPRGRATPLEESVIERSISMGRIFQFSNRVVVNYELVSVLILDLPQDEVAAGRMRDNVAILAESAQAIAETINMRKESARRAEALQAGSIQAYDAIENLRVLYREQQADTRLCMEDLISEVEKTYVHLGLSINQEDILSGTLRDGADRVLQLFERGVQFDGQFAQILEAMRPKAEQAEDDIWL